MISSDISFFQGTITKKINFAGVGLHTGKLIELEVHPSGPNTGIQFQRTDLERSPTILAHPANVVSTTLCTTIGSDSFTVATIEHLMAAFSGLGVDNALVKVNACELPILDGSSAPFVDKLNEAGLQIQGAKRPVYIPRKLIEVRSGDQYATLEPYTEDDLQFTANRHDLEITCSIDFPYSKAIGRQSLVIKVSRRSFMDLCEARTFCHLNDVTSMRSKGLARGGSLDNAIVVNNEKVMNLEGLRYKDEFVRHKVLDCIGDLALLGGRLTGKLKLHKAGHGLHTQLTRKILSTANCSILHSNTVAASVDTKANAVEGMGYMGLAAMAKRDA